MTILKQYNTDMTTCPEPWVQVINSGGKRPILLICEHASNFIPEKYNNLGLTEQQLHSHIAWDPGALGTATIMAQQLDAPLVASQVSRLVYDCNRPPESPTAIPLSSENQVIHGNVGLNQLSIEQRIETYYRPFETTVNQCVEAMASPVVITIHSFTPVYLGKTREVEIGVLHDMDQRFADAFLSKASGDQRFNIQRNQPYAPTDGVTHTLKRHALPGGLLNVMLEIRNDLITTPEQQQKMATYLTNIIALALSEHT